MFKTLAHSRLLHQIVSGSKDTRLEVRKPENPAAPAQSSIVLRSRAPFARIVLSAAISSSTGRSGRLMSMAKAIRLRGRLCAKGWVRYELLTHPNGVKGRYPRLLSTVWVDLELEAAVDMTVDPVWDSRERTFVGQRAGRVVMHATGIRPMSRSTADYEEKYLTKKLIAVGVKMVALTTKSVRDTVVLQELRSHAKPRVTRKSRANERH
jgi:hypothetical protein